MTFKIIQVSGLRLISCLTIVEDDNMHYYCHDKLSERSYSEILPSSEFLLRIRQGNKRVHFPTKAVRAALCSADPVEASLSNLDANNDDIGLHIKHEDGEQQPLQSHPRRTVLSLKYRVEGAPAPLKWEWHLLTVDSSMFFRCALKDALSTASLLNTTLHNLLDVVTKKDKEITQYRNEGAKLLRTTVATEPFDVEAFQLQHKQVFADAASYELVGNVLNDSPLPLPMITSESLADNTKSAEAVSTIPCNSTATNASKILSPRERKRKALEASIQHVERKVLQRRRVPQMLYKDNESQEDDLDACIQQNNEVVKDEPHQLSTVKQESKQLVSIDTETLQMVQDSLQESEIERIIKMIDSTTEETKILLKENDSK